jgi:hypothetical protein
MKTALICLLFCLPAFAQDTLSRFREAEALAPKGFPMPFVVSSAVTQPAQFMGQRNGCEMQLATLGKVYFVTAVQAFGECHAFPAGTTIYGNVKNSMLGQSINLLDNSGSKAKSRQYRVENVQLVDPSQQ